MPKKKQEQEYKERKKGEQSNHVARGIILIVIALIIIGGAVPTPSGSAAGPAGLLFAQGAQYLFGHGFLILPLVLGTYGILTMRRRKIHATLREILTGSLGILLLLGLLSIQYTNGGGIVGTGIGTAFHSLFGGFASFILFVISVTFFILFFDRTPEVSKWWEVFRASLSQFSWRKSFRAHKEAIQEESPSPIATSSTIPIETQNDQYDTAPQTTKKPLPSEEEESESFISSFRPKKVRGGYTPPPLSLLEGDKGRPDIGDIKANTNIIKHTLQNFNIEVEIDEVTVGPSVARYALKPAQGVKLNRIVGLQQNLAMALAAHPLRIEAPIPGKSLVGIEIPNRSRTTIGLGGLLSDPAFQKNQKPLLVAIGKTITGKVIAKSLAEMPHLLISGTTGSGKSVAIHSMITSLLYKHGPEDLRFIFVDPKRVELTLYNKIPHLYLPVITDPKQAVLALKWAATEMNKRLDMFQKYAVRDIGSFKERLAKKEIELEDGEDALPYIVIIIDELADIMLSYPKELEAGIVTLAQKSRAAGIHLILSTQRPDVNVITGLIKANIDSRIALRVPTQIDSRTILDMGGAEKLLGHGDMLSKMRDNPLPERLQGAFLSESELKNIVRYLIDAYKDTMPEMIEIAHTMTQEKSMFGDTVSDDADDDLYEDAREIVIQNQAASTTFLQRKLAIGYSRAARLMDALEERGVVGPANGAKPREVKIKREGRMESDKDIYTPLAQQEEVIAEENL